MIFYYLKGSISENMSGTKFISVSLSSLSRRIKQRNIFFFCALSAVSQGEDYGRPNYIHNELRGKWFRGEIFIKTITHISIC